MEPGSDEAYRDRLPGDLAYLFNNLYHGKRPKRSIEGPQICTQARELSPRVIRGKDFVAVQQDFTYTARRPGQEDRLAVGADDRLPGRQAVFRVVRPDHRRQRQRRDVPADRHARPHQAQGRRHLQRGLPELSRPDPGQRVPQGLRPGREVPLRAEARRHPATDDPRLSHPRPEDRQGRALAGGHDARPVGRLRGLVPPARLRLHDRGVRRPADPRPASRSPRPSSSGSSIRSTR